jgi:hypothetical protein
MKSQKYRTWMTIDMESAAQRTGELRSHLPYWLGMPQTPQGDCVMTFATGGTRIQKSVCYAISEEAGEAVIIIT